MIFKCLDLLTLPLTVFLLFICFIFFCFSIDGVVVCQEFEQVLLDAWREEEELAERRKAEVLTKFRNLLVC